jgi:hypothetical protein
MLKTIRSELGDLAWLLRMAAFAALAGAVYTELRKPPDERTWHGRLFGFVPYDFRPPTPAKVIGAWWNPKSDQVVGDPVFGVGWSINVAALADRLGSSANGSRTTKKTTRRTAKATA